MKIQKKKKRKRKKGKLERLIVNREASQIKIKNK